MQFTSNRKTALITGASSGIGYELAYLFARDGHNLILTARSRDKLDALSAKLEEHFGISSLVIDEDLSHPQAPKEIHKEACRAGFSVDFLVNNAGFGLHGLFSETDRHEELDMIQVNIAALTHLTKLFLPDMLEKGEGRILNVGSIASFQPNPLMAVYAASKAYVLSFSEALANELEGTGITVTALCPGPTKTEFEERASMQGHREFQKAKTPEEVALYGYQQMMEGAVIAIPHRKFRFIRPLSKILPRNWMIRMTRNVIEKGMSR